MNVKVCTKCHVEKPWSEFYKNSKGKHGLDQACKTCRLAANEAYALRCKQELTARVPVTQRRCPTCGFTKSAKEFYRNSRTPDGLNSYCKSCSAERERADRYGLAPGDFERMYDEQGGECLICLEREARVVDHCHVGGQVRGLLCNNCNSGLGYFLDSPTILARAIEYLERDLERR